MPDGLDQLTTAGEIPCRYLHGQNVDEPLMWYQGSGLSGRHRVGADQQGSVVAMTNAVKRFSK